ncbi:MAG TPA: hypothetical protein VLQ93_08185, partial [Myxococcaceae bacterium]|nr:hypothetical protein [Myxococcaceae bacterium]
EQQPEWSASTEQQPEWSTPAEQQPEWSATEDQSGTIELQDEWAASEETAPQQEWSAPTEAVQSEWETSDSSAGQPSTAEWGAADVQQDAPWNTGAEPQPEWRDPSLETPLENPSRDDSLFATSGSWSAEEPEADAQQQWSDPSQESAWGSTDSSSAETPVEYLSDPALAAEPAPVPQAPAPEPELPVMEAEPELPEIDLSEDLVEAPPAPVPVAPPPAPAVAAPLPSTRPLTPVMPMVAPMARAPAASLQASQPSAPAAAVPSAPVDAYISGEHRVIIHTVEGQVKRGIIRDVDLLDEAVPLEQQTGFAPERIPVGRVKAIFFMLTVGSRPPQPEGQKIRVTFNDGRQVAGFSSDDQGTGQGFFVIPADTRTNTSRIFIYRASVQAIAEG